MKTLNSYTNLFILFLNLVWIVASFVEFSKSFENVYKIASEQGVTMAACEAGCERRRFCKSAIYHRRAAYCVYTAMDRSQEHVVTRIGTVLISGFHPSARWGAMETYCGGILCEPTQTCTSDDVGAHVCKASECVIPPWFYPHFSGNLNTIGSKAIYNCTSTVIECGTDGRWTPLAFHDCTDVCGRSGVFRTKVWIYPMFQKSVYCDMDTDGGNWLVFQRRVNGSVNFYRNWTEYRNGFGHPAGEFWLGLEYLHQIVSSGQYELRIDLEDWNSNQRYATYSSVSITDETDNYRLSVSGYSGNAGDALSDHSGRMFSTFDKDNDLSTGNCAYLWKGAWWYNACQQSNLNAIHGQGGYTPVNGVRIHWVTWFEGQNYISIRRTEMKIRRK